MRFGPPDLRAIERSHYHESTQKIYGGNGSRRGEVSKFLPIDSVKNLTLLPGESHLIFCRRHDLYPCLHPQSQKAVYFQ